ncbi:hypothetical protein B0J14DRAFT_486176 [Halenospora varia]|nr:hypothetical protein B0J14DRAFT_486176 [Halenospora varia]
MIFLTVLIGAKAVLWACVGISLAFILFRAYTRLRIFHKFAADDYLLAIAWLTSVTIAGIWQVRATELYFGIALASGQATHFPTDLGSQIERYLRAILGAYIVQYLGLWCVKLSLLFFFKGLGTGIRQQMIFWWCTFAFIVSSFFVCLGTIDYKCLLIIEICTSPSTNTYEYITLRLTTSLDVLTDATLIGLSTNLLWRIRINWRRKVALAGIFSLTAFVIAVAIARVIVATSSERLDFTFILLWGAVELSVSIIVACLASFRTLYTAKRAERSGNSRPKNPQLSKNINSHNNISDAIPLKHQGSSLQNSKNSQEAPSWEWSSQIGGVADNSNENSSAIYVKREYEVHASIRNV